MLQKSASLGLVTHGGSKPVVFSSVLMGNISKVWSYFSRQSIFPEMGILHMFSPFPLLKKKKKKPTNLSLNTLTCPVFLKKLVTLPMYSSEFKHLP